MIRIHIVLPPAGQSRPPVALPAFVTDLRPPDPGPWPALARAADLAGLTKPFTRQFYSAIDPVLVSNYNLTIHPYHAPVLAGDRVMRVGEAIAWS